MTLFLTTELPAAMSHESLYLSGAATFLRFLTDGAAVFISQGSWKVWARATGKQQTEWCRA